MPPVIRIAASGDLHASEEHRERINHTFAELADRAELVLLAGDLTTHGVPEEADVLAGACRLVAPLPVVAVLGNHDHHSGRADEIAATLRDAGMVVLERDHARVTERCRSEEHTSELQSQSNLVCRLLLE